MPQPMAQALLQETIDAFTLHGTQTLAAQATGVSRTTFESRLTEAHRRKVLPSKHIEDLNNPAHLKVKLRRLETELKVANEAALDHTMIKSKIIGLTQNVAAVDPPDWMLDPRKHSSAPGTPTLLCSDWHVGEVVHASQIGGVNHYNMAVFRERVKVLVESTIKLLRIISPKMDYPGIVLPLAGDMISGDIHAELIATNELATMPTVLELYGVLIWVIDQMLEHFPYVFLPCVTGNHGRNTMKIWNKSRHHTSFDWLLYCLLAKHYEGNNRVTFFIPDGPDALYKVYEHRVCLSHGDQFRGGDSMIGALGPLTRGNHKKLSRNAQVGMAYDTMVCGHWHQYISLTKLIVNGSLKGYCEYAYANNFSFEAPQQALWLNHPKYGLTFRMPVYVDTKKLVGKPASWVSVAA